ncbi:MAG: DedA family protein [Nanoarchaeota archaeon]
MPAIEQFIDIIIHLDKYMHWIIQEYGLLTYLILFLIVFFETGFVITPFLPGDSLLFVAGAFAASGSLDIMLLLLLFASAAILGDTVNYWIGSAIGQRAFERDIRFLRREYLEQTREFYEKYGGKTIVIARFLPIVRTFAPFVAGIGKMNYRRFIFFNVAGALLWVATFVLGGYYFGNIPLVKENFTLSILVIILVSFIPPILEYVKHHKHQKTV